MNENINKTDTTDTLEFPEITNWNSFSPSYQSSNNHNSFFNDSSKNKVQEDFWKKSLVFKASTFGGTVKSKDSIDPIKALKDWKGKDSHGHTHSRIQVIPIVGNLQGSPGPGQVVFKLYLIYIRLVHND